MFSCKFREIFKNTFRCRAPLLAASEINIALWKFDYCLAINVGLIKKHAFKEVLNFINIIYEKLWNIHTENEKV